MTQPARPVMPNFCHRQHPFHFATAMTTLVRLGIDLDRVELLADGEHENYRGHIHYQEPKAGEEISDSTRILLHVGLKSAIDLLPYQFFYGFGGPSDRGPGWEDSARRLMAPFDGARIRRFGWEDYRKLSYTLAQSDPEQLERFFALFEFDSDSLTDHSARETGLWLAYLPMLHHWGGNADLVGRALSAVFRYPVRIVESQRSTTPLPDRLKCALGRKNTKLGDETLLGGSFSDIDSSYRVEVTQVEPSEIKHWLPGKRQYKKLEGLLAMVMPGHLTFTIRVYCRPGTAGVGKSTFTSRLGYATRLGR